MDYEKHIKHGVDYLVTLHTSLGSHVPFHLSLGNSEDRGEKMTLALFDILVL